MLTSAKLKKALVLKGIFSETTYECALTYQISSFEFLTGCVIPPSSRTPTSKRTPKKPTQISVKVIIGFEKFSSKS